ncbi:hypothetical protein [Actinosynnema sp. NPDC023587]|uniref:hypothetical protein n=1 Tax=Actinosynnema sp. NPDC023587 TaxID=3154695 RepID=UPI003411397A
MTDNPFHPTDAERREGYALVAEPAAALVPGPVVGPFAVPAARFLYDRREALFDRAGTPGRAFDTTGTAVRPDLGGTSPALVPHPPAPPLRTWSAPVVPRAAGPEPECWWCEHRESQCDCLIGEARRFWRGDPSVSTDVSRPPVPRGTSSG